MFLRIPLVDDWSISIRLFLQRYRSVEESGHIFLLKWGLDSLRQC
jgi:hypothetical protein